MSEISNPTPTIEQLCAIEACREAARRYSYGLDRLDGDVMKSAYWPEAIDEHGRYNGNAWDFCDYCVGSHDKWTWTMHSIYNHRVEIDADGVHGRGEAYCVTHLFDEDERQLSTWYGRYQDTYECRDGEWRIAPSRLCASQQHPPSTCPRRWASTSACSAKPTSIVRPAAGGSVPDARIRQATCR